MVAIGVLTEVVIFDQHIYKPTGIVGRWMGKLTTRFGNETRRAAPVDTGELVAGITARAYQIGPKQVEGTIASNANHTMFVIRGTGFPVRGNAGRIYTTKGFVTRNEEDAYVSLWGVKPRGQKFSRTGKGFRKQFLVRKRGYWLRLPFMARNGGPVFAFSVSGQESNNFFYVAWRRTASDHRAIRGVPFPESLT